VNAGNNLWLTSGKGSGITNPPSAWAVAKRDNPKVAENCWTHAMSRGPKGRFVGHLRFFYGIRKFAKNKPAPKELLFFLSQKESARQLVEASYGYDLPTFRSFYDFNIWKTVGPPLGYRLVSKFSQGAEKLDDIIKWASNELEAICALERRGLWRAL
jgi:hypothetical protein